MDDDDPLGGPPDRWESYRQPVSVDFLSKTFRMSRDSVRKKLGSCREVSPQRYDFVEAAGWLVTSHRSTEEYMSVLKQGDLPPKLQAALWDAMRKRQLWEKEAGDLWHTDAVVEVFGEVFKRFKTSVQLMADTIDREDALTDEQRAAVTRLADGLLRDVHASLADMAKERRTLPQLADEVAPEI